MAVSTTNQIDVCPVCGREYDDIIGPPNTEIVGGVHGTPLELQVTEWLCAYSVGDEVYIVEHDAEREWA